MLPWHWGLCMIGQVLVNYALVQYIDKINCYTAQQYTTWNQQSGLTLEMDT